MGPAGSSRTRNPAAGISRKTRGGRGRAGKAEGEGRPRIQGREGSQANNVRRMPANSVRRMETYATPDRKGTVTEIKIRRMAMCAGMGRMEIVGPRTATRAIGDRIGTPGLRNPHRAKATRLPGETPEPIATRLPRSLDPIGAGARSRAIQGVVPAESRIFFQAREESAFSRLLRQTAAHVIGTGKPLTPKQHDRGGLTGFGLPQGFSGDPAANSVGIRVHPVDFFHDSLGVIGGSIVGNQRPNLPDIPHLSRHGGILINHADILNRIVIIFRIDETARIHLKLFQSVVPEGGQVRILEDSTRAGILVIPEMGGS